MKLKLTRYLIAIGVIPLSILLNSPLMAASTTPTVNKGASSNATLGAKTSSEKQTRTGKDDQDAFEQASGMERDQPTGADPTPGEMKQQQPHNSNIEQEVKEAKEREMKNQTSENLK